MKELKGGRSVKREGGREGRCWSVGETNEGRKSEHCGVRDGEEENRKSGREGGGEGGMEGEE